MGKRRGEPAQEPTTSQGKPFSQMSGEEKAEEFKKSYEDPHGYAQQNFSQENRASGGGKHRK
jgi:hypothetical protein